MAENHGQAVSIEANEKKKRETGQCTTVTGLFFSPTRNSLLGKTSMIYRIGQEREKGGWPMGIIRTLHARYAETS